MWFLRRRPMTIFAITRPPASWSETHVSQRRSRITAPRGGAGPLPAIPHLYYLDPIELIGRSGKPVLPDFTIDVSTTFETKKLMLAKHETQRDWLRQQHKIDDYLVRMEQWTRACGARAGIALGEGFRQYRVHPYPQSPLLQECLAPFLVSFC